MQRTEQDQAKAAVQWEEFHRRRREQKAIAEQKLEAARSLREGRPFCLNPFDIPRESLMNELVEMRVKMFKALKISTRFTPKVSPAVDDARHSVSIAEMQDYMPYLTANPPLRHPLETDEEIQYRLQHFSGSKYKKHKPTPAEKQKEKAQADDIPDDMSTLGDDMPDVLTTSIAAPTKRTIRQRHLRSPASRPFNMAKVPRLSSTTRPMLVVPPLQPWRSYKNGEIDLGREKREAEEREGSKRSERTPSPNEHFEAPISPLATFEFAKSFHVDDSVNAMMPDEEGLESRGMDREGDLMSATSSEADSEVSIGVSEEKDSNSYRAFIPAHPPSTSIFPVAPQHQHGATIPSFLTTPQPALKPQASVDPRVRTTRDPRLKDPRMKAPPGVPREPVQQPATAVGGNPRLPAAAARNGQLYQIPSALHLPPHAVPPAVSPSVQPYPVSGSQPIANPPAVHPEFAANATNGRQGPVPQSYTAPPTIQHKHLVSHPPEDAAPDRHIARGRPPEMARTPSSESARDPRATPSFDQQRHRNGHPHPGANVRDGRTPPLPDHAMGLGPPSRHQGPSNGPAAPPSMARQSSNGHPPHDHHREPRQWKQQVDQFPPHDQHRESRPYPNQRVDQVRKRSRSESPAHPSGAYRSGHRDGLVERAQQPWGSWTDKEDVQRRLKDLIQEWSKSFGFSMI
ncbi:hypothetical protein HDV00_010577 [Rhizophlyctis rosea]|nr:hypothetical protein HDV00_010577 [Rhizophlyctis rosea]